MSFESLFNLANPLAALGWLVLAIAPFHRVWAHRIAGLAIPVILSLLYLALILVHWSSAPGGYNSLPDVLALFAYPATALAGWTHFLAFDLIVGAYSLRFSHENGVPHLLMLPCLFLTFMFGPIGLLCTLTLIGLSHLRARKGEPQ